MKTTTKINIDKYLVGGFVKLLNILVIPVGKILRIDHNLNRDFNRIAICKFKGMGSIIQATPLLKTLKKQYPNATISFITSSENKAILNSIPQVDEIICIRDKGLLGMFLSIPSFFKKLVSKKFQLYIDLEVYSNFSTLVSIFSLATNRLGFYLNSKHYRLGNYTHMMYYNTKSSISNTYLQFARMLNCTEIIEGLTTLKTNVDTLHQLNFDIKAQKYMLVNPNASDLRIERRWPADRYQSLVEQLQIKYTDYYIVLIGSKSESKYVDTIYNSLNTKNNVLTLAGKTNIPELISLIAHANVFITNDSGPMHMAFAMNTPTVGLFGPCSPNQYGYGDNCSPVYTNLYCSPCVHEFVSPPCKGNNRCMTSITVKSVVERIDDILDNRVYDTKDLNQSINFSDGEFTFGTLFR